MVLCLEIGNRHFKKCISIFNIFDDAEEERFTLNMNKPYAETDAVMGKEGGIIDVKGYGVFLSIPMGALQKDIHIKGKSIYTSFGTIFIPTLMHICHSPSKCKWWG